MVKLPTVKVSLHLGFRTTWSENSLINILHSFFWKSQETTREHSTLSQITWECIPHMYNPHQLKKPLWLRLALLTECHDDYLLWLKAITPNINKILDPLKQTGLIHSKIFNRVFNPHFYPFSAGQTQFIRGSPCHNEHSVHTVQTLKGGGCGYPRQTATLVGRPRLGNQSHTEFIYPVTYVRKVKS